MIDRPEESKVYHVPGIRIFECVVNVTGYLEGELDDWPANIQDKIYLALERKADEAKIPITVIFSYCGHDVDEGHYIYVLASEVVAGVPHVHNAIGIVRDKQVIDDNRLTILDKGKKAPWIN